MAQNIPTEQWAQVVEQTGKRKLLQKSSFAISNFPTCSFKVEFRASLTLTSCRLQEDPSSEAWPR